MHSTTKHILTKHQEIRKHLVIFECQTFLDNFPRQNWVLSPWGFHFSLGLREVDTWLLVALKVIGGFPDDTGGRGGLT